MQWLFLDGSLGGSRSRRSSSMMTLYLQDVLSFSLMKTGSVFATRAERPPTLLRRKRSRTGPLTATSVLRARQRNLRSASPCMPSIRAL